MLGWVGLDFFFFFFSISVRLNFRKNQNFRFGLSLFVYLSFTRVQIILYLPWHDYITYLSWIAFRIELFLRSCMLLGRVFRKSPNIVVLQAKHAKLLNFYDWDFQFF